MRVLPVLAIALVAATAAAAGAQRAAAAETVPGELVVGFRSGVSGTARSAVRRRADVAAVRALMSDDRQLVRVRPGVRVQDAIRALADDPRVRYAEPNEIYRAAGTPNDPLYPALWGLPAIGAPAAWSLTSGSSAIRVAIVDSGVAYDHPDLAGNMFSPRGHDFVGLGDADPYDVNGHGTQVAGTVGAVGNNGVGIAGVSWDVSLLSVRVLNAAGTGTTADIAEGLDYAGDMGARVVSAAFAGPAGSKAIEDAILSHPGTLYVAAAGNDASNNDSRPQYPCSYEALNVVCVTGTTAAGALAPASNLGAVAVDLGAPGAAIRSTTPHTDSLTLGSWTSGSWQVDGGRLTSQPRPYGPNTNIAVTTVAPRGGSARGCTLTFTLDLDTQANGDFLLLETSTDQSTWTEQGSWSGRYTGTIQTGLDAAGQDLYIRFRLRSDATIGGAGATIDDIDTACVTGVPSGTSDYANATSSSMAAAHVAGAAALVLARRPASSLSDLRDMLLSSGRPVAALANRTVTGRVVDVRAAMNPPPSRVPATLPATGVGRRSATLNGQLNPAGTAANYQFQYGLTTAYDQVAPGAPTFAGSRVGPVTVQQTIGGLAAGARYHYRVVAVRDGKRLYGADRTFTTPGGTVAGATLADVKLRRCRYIKKRRRIRCRLENTTAVVSARARLGRGRRVIARSSSGLDRAHRAYTLKLKRRLRRGRYVVKLILRDTAGSRRTVRYRFRVR